MTTAKIINRAGTKKIDALVVAARWLKAVHVGVPSKAGKKKAEDGSTSGLTVAYIASIHEYGAPAASIPERPFLRNTIRKHKDKYTKMLKVYVPQVLREKMTAERALGRVGKAAADDVKRFIRNNPYRLADATMLGRKKPSRKSQSSSKSPVALIDTGQLMQSIDYEVKI